MNCWFNGECLWTFWSQKSLHFSEQGNSILKAGWRLWSQHVSLASTLKSKRVHLKNLLCSHILPVKVSIPVWTNIKKCGFCARYSTCFIHSSMFLNDMLIIYPGHQSLTLTTGLLLWNHVTIFWTETYDQTAVWTFAHRFVTLAHQRVIFWGKGVASRSEFTDWVRNCREAPFLTQPRYMNQHLKYSQQDGYVTRTWP